MAGLGGEAGTLVGPQGDTPFFPPDFNGDFFMRFLMVVYGDLMGCFMRFTTW